MAALPHPPQPRLELASAEHTYDLPGRHSFAAKVVDIVGNDVKTLVRGSNVG